MGTLLVVDDEQSVLDAVEEALGAEHELVLERSPLRAVERAGEFNFDVVIADSWMPEMNGHQLLRKVSRISPATTRILMADGDDLPGLAVALNHASISRLVIKPLSAAELRNLAAAALRQTDLVRAERELLAHTLTGSIEMLTETLALASPVAFERSRHARRHVDSLLGQLDPEQHWAVQVAAMVSQVCSVAVPEETLERLFSRGGTLSSAETRMFRDSPAAIERILQHIPRVEPVRSILRQVDPYSLDAVGIGTRLRREAISELPARIVQLALDFDALRARGATATEALERLRELEDCFSPELLHAFAEAQELAHSDVGERELTSAYDLAIGTVLARDLVAKNGLKIVAAGYRVTETVRTRVINFAASPGLEESIWVVESPEHPSASEA